MISGDRLQARPASLLVLAYTYLCTCTQYEAYKPMAEREIHKIIQQARQRWHLRHVAIAHRIGVVPTAESSVEIAISSEHRREALEAVYDPAGTAQKRMAKNLGKRNAKKRKLQESKRAKSAYGGGIGLGGKNKAAASSGTNH